LVDAREGGIAQLGERGVGDRGPVVHRGKERPCECRGRDGRKHRKAGARARRRNDHREGKHPHDEVGPVERHERERRHRQGAPAGSQPEHCRHREREARGRLEPAGRIVHGGAGQEHGQQDRGEREGAVAERERHRAEPGREDDEAQRDRAGVERAADPRQRGQQPEPQRMREHLDTLARVVDGAMAEEELLDRAEGDEGVVAQPRARDGEREHGCERRQNQRGIEPPGHRRNPSTARFGYHRRHEHLQDRRDRR
jgi:hypothetical protein